MRVSKRYPSRTLDEWPRLWLISDARNDAALEAALRRLPRGSGLVFRHYHLPEPERRARFRQLRRLARRRGHAVVLAGTMREARAWGGDGAYGSAALLAGGPAGLRLATVHCLRELGRSSRADAALLSPVFATQSHPGAGSLGALRFLLMAQKSRIPVLALGGMTPRRAARMPLLGWAAIDGLSP